MENWQWREVGDFAKLTKGISYKSEDYGDEQNGAVFITLKCFSKGGGFNESGIKYYKGIMSPEFLLREDDLLIANTDLTRDGDVVGSPLLVPTIGNRKDVVMSMDISRLDFFTGDVDKNYIYYVLSLPYARKFMQENSSGSTVLHLKTKNVPKLKVWLPKSKDVQVTIANILITIDRAIVQTEALIAKHQRIKTGLMHDLLTRGIDEHGQLRDESTHKFKSTPLGMIPVEWEVKALGKIAEINSGVTLGRKLSGENTVELPYLRVANVQDGYLDLSEIKTVTIYASEISRFSLEKGDVLMNEGGDFDKLGRGTVWEGQISPCLHQNHVFRVRANREELLPEFLAAVSSSPYGKKFFVLSSKQSTNLASINSTQLKGFPIPCPRISEQERIIEILKKTDTSIQTHKTSLDKLNRTKQGLMQDLLSGGVSVTPLLEG